jgi:hypothetical protein
VGDRFTCVEDRVDRNISEQPFRTWPDDVRLRGSSGSVIVILPAGATPEVRSRAEELADDLTRGSQRAGRHFVTEDWTWQDIANGKDLARRIADLHQRAAEWRSTGADDGLFMSWGQLNELTPHVIVVPLEGEADRQLVLGGITRESVLFTWKAASHSFRSCDEIAQMPVRALPRDAILPMVDTSEEDDPQLTIFEIVVVKTAGAHARERAMRLASALQERPRVAVYLRATDSAALAQGEVRPEEFQPPYVLDFDLLTVKDEE